MTKSSQKDQPNSSDASDLSGKVDDPEELKDTELKFSVVEFTDGVNIVSTTWLSADGKCCQWPPKKINASYNKLVEFHARPASDWIEAKVVRSFGTYQKFDVAQKKLELALQFSDIDTDVDDLAPRKPISKKSIAEDSDEDRIILPPSPVAPLAPTFQKSKPAKNKKNQAKGATHKGKSPIKDATTSSTSQYSKNKPITLPKSPNAEEHSSATESSRPYANDSPALEITASSSGTISNSELVESESGASSENSSRDKTASSTITYRNPSVKNFDRLEKPRTVHSGYATVSNLKELNEKLQSIEENLAVMTLSAQKTTSALEKLERHLRGVGLRNGSFEGPPAEMLLELETILPLQTMGALEDFESSLKSNPQRAQDVVLMWKRIGGDTLDDAIRRLLRRVFTNRFAEKFSWEGRKGKAKLCDLEITKRMISALSGVTGMNEADFEKRVKEWFRHAKTRRENEEKRDRDRAAADA